MEQLIFQPTEEDLPFEEDVIRNPYVLKAWLRYIEHKQESPAYIRNILYERAVKELPGSYKLWYMYLMDLKRQVRGRVVIDPFYEEINNAFERALVYLARMPRIWLEFGEFLLEQKKITKTRQVLDRALRSISIQQHDRIWKLYMKYLKQLPVPIQTAMRIHRRYMKWDAKHREEYITYLIDGEEWDEAAHQLVIIVNDHEWQSNKGKSRHEMWMLLCDIITKHSDAIKSIKVDKILRGGIAQYSDQVGKLWTTLAEYYIRLGHFDKARDIFEEGMNTVITVRDFTQIWDAYAQFEDSLISAQMDTINEEDDPDEEVNDFDLRMARYEYLIDRQPFLVNSVLLRQNPHNVHEWLKRANLYYEREDYKMVVETYTEAVNTVEAQKAKGRPSLLWVHFAKFYEKDQEDIASARRIFERAVEYPYKFVEDVANVWCEYAEMEIRGGNYQEARVVMQRATAPHRMPRTEGPDGFLPAQNKAHKSNKLWTFYADVEESLGTFLSTKAVYDKMFDLKCVTPQVVINFATFLEENKYYEESFKAYEKGVAQFSFPYVFDIWVAYLTKFIARYGGKKLERARDLFEQVIESAPADVSKVFYVMYANLEEEYGLARRAMAVYDRATRSVHEKDRFAMFSLYIKRATEFFGITRTREIYEKAIEVLPDNEAKVMCMRYAALERKLGEIDRARAIFVHCSQLSDPRLPTEVFWNKWREFEVEHGNEDTFREMLRIKRSVQAKFNTQVNMMNLEMMMQQKAEEEAARVRLMNEMQALEMQNAAAQQQPKYTSSATVPLGVRVANPEEIDLEEEAEGEEEKEEAQPGAYVDTMEVEARAVPKSVIERNVGTVPQEGEEEGGAAAPSKPLGALARLKRKPE